MNIETYGNPNNPVILFLHGGGVGGWMWEDQIQFFKKEYFVIVPELTLVNPQFNIHETALALNQMIAKSYSNRKVVVVGFSIGAQIALAMIGKSPHQYNAAMINSALVIPTKSLFLDILLSWSFPLTKSRLFARLQASSMAVPKKYFNRYFEESLNFTKPAFLNMMTENMRFQVSNQLLETTMPILYTIGNNETKIVKRSLKFLKENSKNASIHIFNKVGHNAPFKASFEFNQLLQQWLKEVL